MGSAEREGVAPPREAILGGLLEIADERMAEAIRDISLRRGYDPADYALVAFGGAGGQHACAVAELLGIAQIVVPRDAGLLSALGLGAAVVERFAQRQVLQPLARVREQLPVWLGELADEAAAAVAAEGVPDTEARIRRRLLYLRFTGQEEALAVELRDGESPEEAFAAAYREIYGYAPEGRTIELESIRVVASSIPEEPPLEALPEEPREAVPAGMRRAWTGSRWADLPVFDRAALSPGDSFAGPALVFESHSATMIAEGWRGRLDGAGNLVLTAAAGQKKGESGVPDRAE